MCVCNSFALNAAPSCIGYAGGIRMKEGREISSRLACRFSYPRIELSVPPRLVVASARFEKCVSTSRARFVRHVAVGKRPTDTYTARVRFLYY